MGKVFCSVCQKRCKGDVLKIGEQYVHKNCFHCERCQKNLEKGGFFVKDKRFYCPDDYQKDFGVKCGICHEYVEGDVVTVLGNTFHVQCFRCQNCRKPFHSGERATLWEGEYLCKACSLERQEKENLQPLPDSETDVAAGDSSGYETRSQPASLRSPERKGLLNGTGPVNGELHVHVSDTGYTSTDSTGERLRSEPGYFSQASPCYSLSSGDESSTRHGRSRQSSGPYEPKYPVDYGKHFNVSYLRLESDQSSASSPRDRFKRQNSPSMYPPKSPHFHRPPKDKFSYRAQAHLNYSTPGVKKGMSILSQPSTPRSRGSRSVSPSASVSSEEPIRLSMYPGGHERQISEPLPIERYDWPAPPSPAVVMMDRRSLPEGREKRVSQGEESMESQSPARSQVSMASVGKLDHDIQQLSRTADKSGMSKAVIRDLQKAKEQRARSPELDPVSASRTPNAAAEPHYKTRFDKHLFASPSRDNRRDRREFHTLSYKMDYSSTGGRSGTLQSCPSTPRPGYTQGYLQSSSRGTSLPRHPMDYSDTSYVDSRPSDELDGQISPFTTSGFSVDGAPSVEDGYMSAPEGPRRRRHRHYDSDVDLAYPSVQSWLRPSSLFRLKDPVPPKIYSYEVLKVTNFEIPKDVDRNRLEDHLSEEEFYVLFEIPRQVFSRLPEWKRNDLKRRLHLY